MPDLRLIRAEVLKLRRRRSMLAVCAVLTLVAVAGYYAVLAALHLTDAAGHGPAGGLAHFEDAVGLLGMTAGVAGVIVGATAGGADIEAGVFRDLAATGRGRIALFAARLPGALAVLLPILVAAVALPALLSAVLSGGEPLTASAVGDGALLVLASGALTAAISVGLAALFGARGMVMGVVLAVFLGIDPVLAQIEAIGDARHLIPQVAVAGLGGGDGDIPTVGAAVAIVLGWAAAALSLGAWRTRTQEI